MAGAHNTPKKWLWEERGRVYIALSVTPGAKQAKLRGFHGERLKLAVKAPPLDGRANEAVIEFLCTLFGLPKRAITLEHGESSREKVVAVSGLDLRTAEQIVVARLAG